MASRSHHPKLKPPPRPLFSCGIFRNCTQSVLSPTAPSPPPPTLPPPPNSSSSPPPPLSPPPPPPPPAKSSTPPPDPTPPSSSSSSSSSASHSFTQWRFPLHHAHHPQPAPDPTPRPTPDRSAASPSVDLDDAFRSAESLFNSANPLPALRLLERSLSAVEPAGGPHCPPAVMSGVVAALKEPAMARQAAKVLLLLALGEGNRRTAVEAGAVAAAVEAVGGAAGERALAALELMCTTDEGAEKVRGHALAAAALAAAVEGGGVRGRELGIGVMAAVYGGERAREAPWEVARAVVAAVQQGECSARGRRKGKQLLRALQESGRLDLIGDGRMPS